MSFIIFKEQGKVAYFYCWVVFVISRALYVGFQNYKENRDAGYNKVLFEQTGQRIEFYGGFGETISCTIVGALRQIFSVAFLISTTLYFLPVVVLLFYISK
ncbi:hypothetical protein ACFL0B_07490 [Thermodesulfobacteriota bacterium]